VAVFAHEVTVTYEQRASLPKLKGTLTDAELALIAGVTRGGMRMKSTMDLLALRETAEASRRGASGRSRIVEDKSGRGGSRRGMFARSPLRAAEEEPTLPAEEPAPPAEEPAPSALPTTNAHHAV
jgi:hypothetical protein